MEPIIITNGKLMIPQSCTRFRIIYSKIRIIFNHVIIIDLHIHHWCVFYRHQQFPRLNLNFTPVVESIQSLIFLHQIIHLFDSKFQILSWKKFVIIATRKFHQLLTEQNIPDANITIQI